MFADRTNWNLAPNRLSEALEKYKATGKSFIDLTVSNPTECGFSYDSEAILRALQNPAALNYEPNAKGLESARQAVVKYYSDHETSISPDDIILICSTSEAYSYVFRTLCNPGDEILIPQPSYPLFSFLADIQDVKLVPYPLIYDHGWFIDFHALEQAITSRARAVIVVHPNNPTGHFCKRKEMEKLSEICVTREIAIIADEVFLDFSLGTDPVPTFAANPFALTFTMSGISKVCGLPQMKLAWLTVGGPAELKREALSKLEVIADTYLSVSSPIQLALSTLLEQRHPLKSQILARVKANLAELDRHLALNSNCNRLAVEGGWYAVLRVPATQSDDEIALELLTQKGVYLHPGHFYDFASSSNLVVSLLSHPRDIVIGIEKLLSKF